MKVTKRSMISDSWYDDAVMIMQSAAYLRYMFFFFSSRRRHTRLQGDWSSDVCSSDLVRERSAPRPARRADLPGRRSARRGRAEEGHLPEACGLGDGEGEPVLRPRHDKIGRASCRERV